MTEGSRGGAAVLVLNAGSSSIKFGLFALADGGRPSLMARGTVTDGGEEPGFSVTDPSGAALLEWRMPDGSSPDALYRALLGWAEAQSGAGPLAAVGHRIVHGGRLFAEPVTLTEDTVAALDQLTPLAPLHQPRCLQPVRALRALRPKLPQIGCFDTAFHHALEPPVSRYALPRRFEAAGVRKYGFHGLSYEYVAGLLNERGLADRRSVVAHLGGGASLCAMRGGRSVDTTMGFSVLDGLMMGTRPGALDPGVVLHLQREFGLGLDEVEHILYHQSGLKGVSGLSGDTRALLGSDDAPAREALDLYAFRAAREVAAMTSTLQGLDALVFTGGVGQHQPAVRAAIAERLGWLGVAIDPEANDRGAERIEAPGSRVAVLAVPTDEEGVIARHVADRLRSPDSGGSAGGEPPV